MKIEADSRLAADAARNSAGHYLDTATGYDWEPKGSGWVAYGVDPERLKRELDLKAKGGHWVSGDPSLTRIYPKTIHYFCVSFKGDTAHGYYTEIDHED